MKNKTKKQLEKELEKSESERKQAQEKFNLLAKYSPDVIYMLNLKNEHYTYVSSSAEKVFGYTPKETLSLKPQDVLTPESYKKQFKEMQKALESVKKSPDTLQLEAVHKDGHTFPVEVHADFIRDENGNPVAILGIARDITERKKTEEELKETLKKLRGALGGTIQVVESIVEERDPYTAGHQRRVTDLARSIAKEMRLSSDQIDAVRMAGAIHDIGKISLPSEILSKPTRLTEAEFELIKKHPQVGYEILKNIEFPWSVAEIVLQHHERLDGSGYPQGLVDGQILMEARVLGVADVMEAMSSHRPYRAALGKKKALEEIKNNRRILYEPRAVDACVKLIVEKGYEFKQKSHFPHV
ncbi:HD-GYP domain-containing protein [bacterium]|nr:HD-GYP domain-containing protein [bacterium]